MEALLKDLNGRVAELIQRYEASRKEIKKLKASLMKGEAAVQEARARLQRCEESRLTENLNTILPEEEKAILRRTLDTLIGEVDTILRKLHD